MASGLENYIKNANSNKEIRKLCSNSKNLLHGDKESLNKPKHLIDDILQKLSLKGKLFEICEPATTQIKLYEDALEENFDENILSLILKTDFSKTKYPKFTQFYDAHCISRTYFFHVYKCSEQDCQWHKPLRSSMIEVFGEPVPILDENNTTQCSRCNDPPVKRTKKSLPQKMILEAKRNKRLCCKLVIPV